MSTQQGIFLFLLLGAAFALALGWPEDKRRGWGVAIGCIILALGVQAFWK